MEAAPHWVDCETGERPRWLRTVIAEGVLLALGPLLLVLSTDVGEPWRLVIFVLGCGMAGLGVWSMLILGFMALISIGVRHPKALAPVTGAVMGAVTLAALLLDLYLITHH